MYYKHIVLLFVFVLFQAEDGIRYLVRSLGLGDVYKRQHQSYFKRRIIGPGKETADDEAKEEDFFHGR